MPAILPALNFVGSPEIFCKAEIRDVFGIPYEEETDE
jgi:hypothetical protein